MERFTAFLGSALLTLICLTKAYVSVAAVQSSDAGWVRLNAGAFSLYAPQGWKFQKEQGIDSYVGKFTGDGVLLDFDYGAYSSPLDEATTSKYYITYEQIAGRKAKVVAPRSPGRGLTAAYFEKATGRDKLCIWAQDVTKQQQALVLKILRTIRFP